MGLFCLLARPVRDPVAVRACKLRDRPRAPWHARRPGSRAGVQPLSRRDYGRSSGPSLKPSLVSISPFGSSGETGILTLAPPHCADRSMQYLYLAIAIVAE